MRKWIIAGVVAVLCCGTLALYYMDSLVASNKDHLLGWAQQMTGRKVSVGNVQVMIFSGLAMRVDEFVLSDDPAYSSGDFLRAGDLQVSLEFLPLLLGQFRIKRMILHDPVITIVRDAAGSYNFSTIGRNGKQKKTKQSPDANSLTRAVPLSSLDVSNGTLRYRDLRDGSELTISRLGLRVTDLAYDSPVTVELAAAIFAPQQNLKLSMVMGPFSPDVDIRDVRFDGQARVESLDMGKVRAAVPRLRKTLPKVLDVRGVYTIEDLKFKGTLNKPWLKGAIEGTDGSFRFE
ncbi:MAG: hypothetical protein GEU77_06025 [Deltaproteobacteria bacterium]|nr:hypothetical protein [Deltaproteobacteria bacterium]